MDPNIVLLFALALALSLAWLTTSLLFKEKRKRQNDLRRYRDAKIKHLALIAEQKDDLIAAIVDRIKIYDKQFMICNSGVFNKVVDLYADPVLLNYELPVATTDKNTFYWERSIFALSQREIFTLWLEGVIE